MRSDISERLKKYREYAGLSEKDLAKAAGVETASVKSWENAGSFPSDETLDSLCRVYNVNRDQLTHLDPDELIDTDSPAPAAAKSEGPLSKSAEPFRRRDRRFAFVLIPAFAAALAVFLTLGLAYGMWHPSWLVFLCVPVVYTLIKAVVRGKLRKFDYPMLVVVLYLFTGFVLGNWHPSWIVFLTVPVFYIAF